MIYRPAEVNPYPVIAAITRRPDPNPIKTLGLKAYPGPSALPVRYTALAQLPRLPAMDTNPQRPKHGERALSWLNVAIDGMNLAKEVTSMTPAKGVFGSVSIILTMIRVRPPL